jgi:ribosomal protein L4
LREKVIKNAGKKTLVVSTNNDLRLAVRNLPEIKYIDAVKVNAKHIVDSTKVLVDKDTVKMLEERLTNGK